MSWWNVILFNTNWSLWNTSSEEKNLVHHVTSACMRHANHVLLNNFTLSVEMNSSNHMSRTQHLFLLYFIELYLKCEANWNWLTVQFHLQPQGISSKIALAWIILQYKVFNILLQVLSCEPKHGCPSIFNFPGKKQGCNVSAKFHIIRESRYAKLLLKTKYIIVLFFFVFYKMLQVIMKYV